MRVGERDGPAVAGEDGGVEVVVQLFEHGDEDDERLMEEAQEQRQQEKEKEKEKEDSDKEATRGTGRAVAISDGSHGPEENRCPSQEKQQSTLNTLNINTK